MKLWPHTHTGSAHHAAVHVAAGAPASGPLATLQRAHRPLCQSQTISKPSLQVNETTLEITELPIRRWTQDYKEFLETLIKPEDKGAALLTDYREHHSGSHVHFTLQVSLCSVLPDHRCSWSR